MTPVLNGYYLVHLNKSRASLGILTEIASTLCTFTLLPSGTVYRTRAKLAEEVPITRQIEERLGFHADDLKLKKKGYILHSITLPIVDPNGDVALEYCGHALLKAQYKDALIADFKAAMKIVNSKTVIWQQIKSAKFLLVKKYNLITSVNELFAQLKVAKFTIDNPVYIITGQK